MVATECFLQIVIYTEGLEEKKAEPKPNKMSLIKHNKTTTPTPKYLGSQYCDDFCSLIKFQRNFIRQQFYFIWGEYPHPFQLFY